MRWPNRHPRTLTRGMHEARRVLAECVPLLDWSHFRRRNPNNELSPSTTALACFACGDENQVLGWDAAA